MKSNVNMKNGTVKSGEFTYCRMPRKLKAYENEYTIPVRTVEFEEKLDCAAEKMAETDNSDSGLRSILSFARRRTSCSRNTDPLRTYADESV